MDCVVVLLLGLQELQLTVKLETSFTWSAAGHAQRLTPRGMFALDSNYITFIRTDSFARCVSLLIVLKRSSSVSE